MRSMANGSAFLAFLGQVSGCSAHGLFAAQNLTGSGFAACTTTEDMGAVRRLVRFPAFTVTEFYALGASALIAVATVLLLVIQPLTTPPAPVADEAPRFGVGFVVASAWQLVTKALATAVDAKAATDATVREAAGASGSTAVDGALSSYARRCLPQVG